MDTPRLNLLAEPLIRIRDTQGQAASLTLPELFVALTHDTVRDYPALRPHQRHPWHSLLVQLAAMALHQAGESQPWETPADWQRALLALTPDHPDGAAFCLVSPHDQPAFLQSPVPGGALDGWKVTPTPDALDMLVTSKKHDLKGEVMKKARTDDWLFALCALQTEGTYTKAGPTEFYYGSVRMSGLQGSRPHVGIRPNGAPGLRWHRDLLIALDNYSKISDTYGFDPSGLKLTWSVVWSRESKSIPLATLDPLFIEICRLVRLTLDAPSQSLRALRRGSVIQRVAGRNMQGNIGDLWTPIDRKYNLDSPSAFQIGKRGISYDTAADIVYPQTLARFIPSPAQRLLPSDGDKDLSVLICGIGRGAKGVSAGLRYREVPIPSNALRLLRRGQSSLIARISKERVESISSMKQHVLWPALTHLFDTGRHRDQGEKTTESVGERASSFCSIFERTEDARFFDDLNIELDADTEADRHAERLRWLIGLAERAETVLRSAFAIGPQCGERRYRARSRALSYFHGALRSGKHFPELAQHLHADSFAEETAP